MRVQHEFRRDHLRGQARPPAASCRAPAGAVADPEHMGVDRHGGLAERHVEHDIGGLAPDAGQRFQRLALRGTSPPYSSISFSRQRDDVLGLVAIEADGLDAVAQPRPRRAPASSAACRRPRTAPRVALLTPASVACADSTTATSRVKGLTMFELALRLRIGFAKAAEGLVDLSRCPGTCGFRLAFCQCFFCDPPRPGGRFGRRFGNQFPGGRFLGRRLLRRFPDQTPSGIRLSGRNPLR